MSNDIFNPQDGAIKAFAILSEMRQVAADKGLDEYITCTNNDTAKNALIKKPELEPTSSSQAAIAMYTVTNDRYDKQQKLLGELRENIKRKISSEAYSEILKISGTPLGTSLNAREIYWAFGNTYAKLTTTEVANIQSVLYTKWNKGKSLKKHIEDHLDARAVMNANSSAIPDEESKRVFLYSLDSLINPNEQQLMVYRIPAANHTDSFLTTATIWLRAIREGKFPGLDEEVITPAVNKITEIKKTARSFKEKSLFYKEKFKEADADADCPVHTKKSNHKWCDCDFYVGKRVDRKTKEK